MFFEQGDFLSQAGATPSEIQRKREKIQAMMGQYGNANYVGEGIADMFTGIMNGVAAHKLNKEERAKRKETDDLFASVMGGAPTYATESNLSGKISGNVAAPQQPQAAPTGGNASPMVANPAQGGEWLKYANEGAIRNKPISGDLESALSFLPELGVTMEVFSGGQDAKGQGDRRTGSTRHDHGNAADVFFYKDGKKLDWANPADRPIFEEIVRRGRAAGVTGFGAGDGYMQPGSMHIGFGGEAVWGAGGKGENAPSWLQAAYNGGGAPVMTDAMPAYNGPSAGDLRKLQANPWLTPDQRAAIEGQIKLAEQASDPMRALQMQQAQQNLQRGAMEMQQMQNPMPEAQRVQSSSILDDGTSVLIMSDGSRLVRGPSGNVLTGQEAADAVKLAREYTVQNQTDIYAGRRQGTLQSDTQYGRDAAYQGEAGKLDAQYDLSGQVEASKDIAKGSVDAGLNAWESYGRLQTNLSNIDQAIAAIDEGARSGVIYNMLPSVTKASADLENAMNRMGLDVVSAVTFGALSEKELRVAMNTAVPQNLRPEELREWLVERRAAQEKTAAMLADAAQYLTTPGNTINGWIQRNTGGKPSQASPANNGAAPEHLSQQDRDLWEYYTPEERQAILGTYK